MSLKQNENQSRIATASICTDDDAVYRENLEVLVGKGYRAGSTVTSDGFSILTVCFRLLKQKNFKKF